MRLMKLQISTRTSAPRDHSSVSVAFGGLIAMAIGIGIGRFVYKEHHDPNVDQPKAKKTTWLKPMVVPFYDRGTVGATATCHM